MDNAASIAAKDTASIDSGASPISVNLPGSVLNLSGLSLGGTGGVNLVGRGTIELAGTLHATGGSHLVAADVTLVPAANFRIETGARLTIGGLVSGGALSKQGAGTLQLATGYTSMETATISEGRLELGNGVGVPVIGDNQLSIAGGQVRAIYLGSGAELSFNVTRNVTFTNLEILGPGAANVSSVNPNYLVNWKNGLSEVTINPGGVVDLATLNTQSNLRVSEATFTYGQTTLSVTNPILITGSLGLEISGGGHVAFSGVISGSGTLVKGRTGVVTLAGSNSFAGGTRINDGTLVSLNANALGIGEVALAATSKLVLNLVGSGTISNLLSGPGSVVKSGTGTLTLANSANNFNGGTTVTSGSLQVNSDGVLGSGSVSLAPSTCLLVSGGAGSSVMLANNLSGTGSLMLNSPATVSLTGFNTLTGGIAMSAGTLTVSSTTPLGTGALSLSGGILYLSAPVKLTTPLVLSKVSGLESSAGASILGAGLSGTGTLQLTGELAGSINVTSGAVTISGGAVNSLVKAGTGTLTLSSTTQLAGSAVVSAGTLVLTDATQTLANVTTLIVGNTGSTGAVLNVGAPGATLSSGQTLKGIGTVSGVMKLSSGSKLSPGNSIGTQQIEGRLEVGPGVVYDAEFKMVGNTLSSDLYRVIGAGTGREGNVTAGSIFITGGIVAPVQEINRSTRADINENNERMAAVKGTGLSTGRITDFSPHVFTILSSTIGAVIAGTFDYVVSGAVLKTRLEYVNGERVVSGAVAAGLSTVSTEVRMVVQRVPYRTTGAVGNRAEVAQGLDQSLATKDPLLWNVLDILDAAQTEGEVVRLLDQLNPKAFSEVYSLALSRLQDVQKTVSDRLTLLGTAMTTLGEAEVLSLATGQGSEWTGWTNAYGSWSAREAKPSLGEGGSTRSSTGNVTGLERRFGALTLGLLGALGTSSTQLNQPSSTVTSESWHLGLYLSTPVVGRVFADGGFFFGGGENVIKRTQTLPTTDSFGTPSVLSLSGRTRIMNQEWLVQLGGGAQLAPTGSKWSVVPTVRVAYAGVRQEGGRESGALSMGIVSDPKWNGTVLTRTGLDISKEGRVGRVPVRATGNAAWVHDFEADPRRLGVRWQGLDSVPWMISSERRSADVLRLGVSLELGLGERRTLRLYAEQEYLQNTKVLRGGVTLTIGF